MTVGTALMAIYGFTALLGMGVGSSVNAAYPVAQALVTPEEISDSVGFTSVAQSFGITFFLAVAGSIFQNTAVKNVSPLLSEYSVQQIRSLAAGTYSTEYQTLPEAARASVVAAIVASIKNVWYLLLAASAACFILSLFLGRNKLFA
ncbi:hypothetical protein W97_07918 [Coniosporium apollinis CBS 100218]|uniref:Major facilitator superfamily (MFS) profile domain-containing protein n=1 Tax=Coniosporium apollinis (strain CBS 100218) TaxID=1168221 RepID=R7Z3A3_CONA1|nr:uncharacterized protein W97_07918 [Coniosporium apollinis CBS 100218]EON68660.1 hypothetical protein W97_07918 [Coniosporium apollinis CBS 100218]